MSLGLNKTSATKYLFYMAYISVSSVEMSHLWKWLISFDLAYSRCCFGGSDNHFDFVEFICAHSLPYSFACTVVDLQGFVTFNIVFYTLASVSHIKH